MTNCLQLLSLTVSAGDPSLRMQKHVDDKQSSESGRGFGLNEADEDAVVDVLDAKADQAVAVLAESHLPHGAPRVRAHRRSRSLIRGKIHSHVLAQSWVQ